MSASASASGRRSPGFGSRSSAPIRPPTLPSTGSRSSRRVALECQPAQRLRSQLSSRPAAPKAGPHRSRLDEGAVLKRAGPLVVRARGSRWRSSRGARRSLLLVPAWALVEGRIFDLPRPCRPSPPEPGALIVAIDEPSFAEIGRQWPWPRDLHARLVESLRRAGAKAIGLDIIFAEPSTAAADAALAAALGPDVTLAARPDADRDAAGRADDPGRARCRNSRRRARDPGSSPSGSTVTARCAASRLWRRLRRPCSAGLGRTGHDAPAGRACSSSSGRRASYQTISYYQALDPEHFLPQDALEGKTVLVGLSLQIAPAVDKRGADVFATPFSFATGRLTAGVEVQATSWTIWRTACSSGPRPFWRTSRRSSAAALGAGLLTRRRRPGAAAPSQLAAA